MALKMKELVLATGESKSTILYYLKEGLLPKPQKPKPNVHLYDEHSIEIVRLIKYLQHNFSYSISEIKAIFAENHFSSGESFEMMVNALELISGAKENQWYTTEEFLQVTSLQKEELLCYQKRGLLFQRAKGFSTKEVEIASILTRAKALGLESALLDRYVETAKLLAKEEFDAGAKMMQAHHDSQMQDYALFFDLLLTLKPYICNMHTVREYQTRYQSGEASS